MYSSANPGSRVAPRLPTRLRHAVPPRLWQMNRKAPASDRGSHLRMYCCVKWLAEYLTNPSMHPYALRHVCVRCNVYARITPVRHLPSLIAPRWRTVKHRPAVPYASRPTLNLLPKFLYCDRGQSRVSPASHLNTTPITPHHTNSKSQSP